MDAPNRLAVDSSDLVINTPSLAELVHRAKALIATPDATDYAVAAAIGAVEMRDDPASTMDVQLALLDRPPPTAAPTRPCPTIRLVELRAGSGVMVALWLPDALATAIALPDGEDPDDLHCTLAYLGRDVDPLTIARAAVILGRCADSCAPLSGVLGGIGRFSASATSDGMDVIYASVDAPGLGAFRACLVAALESGGVPVKKGHDFTPHVTLAYIAPDAPTPIERLTPAPVAFEGVGLSVAGDVIEFSFGGELALPAVTVPAVQRDDMSLAGMAEAGGLLPPVVGVQGPDVLGPRKGRRRRRRKGLAGEGRATLGYEQRVTDANGMEHGEDGRFGGNGEGGSLTVEEHHERLKKALGDYQTAAVAAAKLAGKPGGAEAKVAADAAEKHLLAVAAAHPERIAAEHLLHAATDPTTNRDAYRVGAGLRRVMAELGKQPAPPVSPLAHTITPAPATASQTLAPGAVVGPLTTATTVAGPARPAMDVHVPSGLQAPAAASPTATTPPGKAPVAVAGGIHSIGAYLPPATPATPNPDTPIHRAMADGSITERRTLSTGGFDPITKRPIDAAGASHSEKLTLQTPDGSTVTAIWKPRDGEPHVIQPDGSVTWFSQGDPPPGSFHLRERAVANVAPHLGIPVMPTVVRDVDGQPGSAQQWKDGARRFATGEELPRADAEKLRIADYILGNNDRNSGNVLTTPGGHIAIDHGPSLPLREIHSFVQPASLIQNHTGPLLPETQAHIAQIDGRAIAQSLAQDGIERQATEGALLRLRQLQAGHTAFLEVPKAARGAEERVVHGTLLLHGSAASLRAITPGEGPDSPTEGDLNHVRGMVDDAYAGAPTQRAPAPELLRAPRMTIRTAPVTHRQIVEVDPSTLARRVLAEFSLNPDETVTATWHDEAFHRGFFVVDRSGKTPRVLEPTDGRAYWDALPLGPTANSTMLHLEDVASA